MHPDELFIGKHVHYAPVTNDEKLSRDLAQNGRIKSFNDKTVWVVYKCNNDWDNYHNYTGCATNIADLKEGWV